jgi:hypothetical protein
VQLGEGGLPPAITVGYLLLAALCYGFSYLPYEETNPEQAEPNMEISLEPGKINLPT